MDQDNLMINGTTFCEYFREMDHVASYKMRLAFVVVGVINIIMLTQIAMTILSS